MSSASLESVKTHLFVAITRIDNLIQRLEGRPDPALALKADIDHLRMALVETATAYTIAAEAVEPRVEPPFRRDQLLLQRWIA